MRAAAGASVGLHMAVLAALLLRWHWPAPRPMEVPAQIAMIFGKNARTEGAPARNPAPAVAPAASGAAASRAAASPAAAPRPAVAAAPTAAMPMAHMAAAAPPAAAVPVRLGDGMAGFDVDKPDPGIVPAVADPGNRPPPYPDSAWRRREHGKVVLRIHVGPDGLVVGIDTLQSSGFADLDEAAIAAARRWRFIPQFRDGRPVPSVRDQALDFILE